jgi:hypothetical protein
MHCGARRVSHSGVVRVCVEGGGGARQTTHTHTHTHEHSTGKASSVAGSTHEARPGTVNTAPPSHTHTRTRAHAHGARAARTHQPGVQVWQRQLEHALNDARPVAGRVRLHRVGHRRLQVLVGDEQQQPRKARELRHAPQQPALADARAAREVDLVPTRCVCVWGGGGTWCAQWRPWWQSAGSQPDDTDCLVPRAALALISGWRGARHTALPHKHPSHPPPHPHTRRPTPTNPQTRTWYVSVGAAR